MHATVETTEWLTPSLVRVVLGGPGLVDFAMPADTDAYVNVAIPPQDVPYGPIFDPKWRARRTRASGGRPAAATRCAGWTPRPGGSPSTSWCTATPASPARGRPAAQPGDVLVFEGPGGGYRPDPDADWHLLVGDESALPAIAASLEVLPAGARAVVRLVCDGPDHELPLPTEADVDLVWLHRSTSDDRRRLLPDAVAALDFPPGRVQAFVHGEADEIRALRRHLLGERGLTRADMSCSPYWRRDMTDEDWRAVKRDFVAAMESDV